MQNKKKGRAAPSPIRRAACVLLTVLLVLTSAVPGFASGRNTAADSVYSVALVVEGRGSLSFRDDGTGTDSKDFSGGESVSVVAEPGDGYAVSTVSVTDEDGHAADVDVDSLVSVDEESLEAAISFTMPACDVYVTVAFAPAPNPSLLTDATDGVGEGTDAAAAEEGTGEVTSLMSGDPGLSGSSAVTSEPVLTALSTSSSITYSRVDSQSYGTYSTYLGLAELDSTSYTAFCLEPNKNTPTEGTYTITEWTNNLARAVAYYGYAGPGYSNSTYGMLYKLFGGDTNNQNIGYAYVYQHIALSYVYNGTTAFTGVPDDGTIDAIIAFVDSMNNSTCFATVPTYFHVYQFCTGSSTYQTECFSLTGEYGYAKLIKESANTDLTDGHSAYYHLGNAIYGVYSDSACTSKVGTMTTDGDGSSNGVAVAPGTYYVKEISASTGYQLDTTVYPVTVTAANTADNPATVRVKEPPMDIYIRIRKTAYTDSSCTTESTVSKLDAKYGIYASYDTAQSDTDGSGALEVLSTDANGEAACASAYPLGMYYVKEIGSPEGLALDETIHEVDATSPSTSGQWYEVQSADLETRYVMLIKESADTDLTDGRDAYYHLGNATYGVYKDSDCTSQVGTLTTTADGSSNSVRVLPGTYYVKEISASTGYQLDPAVYPVTVTAANTADNPAKVTVKEPPQDIYIRIKKTAYTDISCTTESTVSKVGAKYGIYSSYTAAENDTDGSAALEILSTDANGEAACAAAYPLGVYYVKEFESPDGLDLDEAIHEVDATSPSYSGQWYEVQSADLESYGTISIRKYGMVTGNSIGDAVYYVYSDEDCTTLAYDRNGGYALTTVAGAESNVLSYRPGTYYVKEVASPVGTVLNATKYPEVISAGQHTYVGQSYGVEYVTDDEYGWVNLVKKNPVDDRIVAGATYWIYTDAACTTRAREVNMYGQYTSYAVLTTTATGSNTVTLKPGTYYVKEYDAPDDYTLNEDSFTITASRGETLTYTAYDTPQVPVKLKKTSGNTDFTDGNSSYSLAGAEYGVYETLTNAQNDTNRIATLTTDENGDTETLYLDCDTNGGTAKKTYYIKELKASPGYSLCDGENDDADSNGIHKVTLDPADYETTQEIICVEPPQYGYIEVYKESGNTDITDGNSLYSLLGAAYGVYTDENCTGTPVTTITTTELKHNDKYGYGKSGKLPLGTYYVKETSSSTGYCLDGGIYKVIVASGTTTPITCTVNSTESPDNDSAGLTVTKIQETDMTYLNEYLTDMSGTQFTIRYFAGQYSSASDLPSAATRTWVIQTKAECETCGSGFDSREDCAAHLQSVHGVAGDYNDYIEYKSKLIDEFLIDSLSDELYYDENGIPCIPLGTITVEETKYAEGYTTDGSYMLSGDGTLISDNDGVILLNVITDHESGKAVTTGGGQLIVQNMAGNEITKMEDIRRGSITIHKKDSGGNALEGVTYQLYIWDGDAQDYISVDSYDGVTSTDDSGTLVYSNLPSGTYRITEVSTADGTSLLAEPIDGIALPLSSEDFDVSSVQNLAAATFSDNGVDYWMDLTFEITNNRVIEFPSAGDSGGIPVTAAAGGLCVLASGLLILVRQKRKSALHAV